MRINISVQTLLCQSKIEAAEESRCSQRLGLQGEVRTFVTLLSLAQAEVRRMKRRIDFQIRNPQQPSAEILFFLTRPGALGCIHTSRIPRCGFQLRSAPFEKEAVMNPSSQPSKQPPPITIKTPMEAICMICFATIRPALGEGLYAAAKRHQTECAGSLPHEICRALGKTL